MKKNMGYTDRIIRVIIAVILVVLYFSDTVTRMPGIILLILASVSVLTSLVGFCPLYLPFRFSSTRKKISGTGNIKI